MSPAVLAGGWLASGSRRWKLRDWWTLQDAADLASVNGCPTVLVVDRERHALDDRTAVEVTGGGADDPVSVWRLRVPGPDGPVSFVMLPADVGRVAGPWHNLSPGELVDALAAFDRLLGVSWSDSVGHTAESLILSTHPRAKGGTLLDRSPFVPEPCASGSLELPWGSWRRDLFDAERAASHVHVFDANAQYLAAWITVEVGHGQPEHLHDRTERWRGHELGKAAGVWRLAHPPAVLDPGLASLPPVATPEREWVTTPTLARLAEVNGSAPELVEAWVWPRKSRFLRAAGERLRDARLSALDAIDAARDVPVAAGATEADAHEAVRRIVTAGAVLDAVKSLYTVQTGRFGMDRDPRSGWRRPDWAHTIRAQARVNMHRRLAGLGARPFAIATDAVAFASSEPDPVVFAESIRLPLGRNLGQYKHVSTGPSGPVWEAFDNESGVLPLLRAVYENRAEVSV